MRKIKVLFRLKGGQKEELLLNLIFPDYPDGSESDEEKIAKEKEADKSTSLSGCSYTPRLVTRMLIIRTQLFQLLMYLYLSFA